ncbi:hypothetical protein [Sulfurovum sp.]|nr:hypothetical protein [Sulfurovum sp.]
MPDKEYEKIKQERTRKDKKTSIIVFTFMLLALVGGIVFIALNVSN